MGTVGEGLPTHPHISIPADRAQAYKVRASYGCSKWTLNTKSNDLCFSADFLEKNKVDFVCVCDPLNVFSVQALLQLRADKVKDIPTLAQKEKTAKLVPSKLAKSFLLDQSTSFFLENIMFYFYVKLTN